MPIKTTIIDLGDGDTAEVFTELRHGTMTAMRPMANLVTKEETDAMTAAKAVGTLDQMLEHNPIISGKVNAITEQLIINQVKTWSFGLVTLQILNDLPGRKYDLLTKKCDELFGGAAPFVPAGGVS